MDTVNPHPDIQKMSTTTLAEQYTRQRISQEWQPKGYARYVQSKKLLDGMSILGGEGDNGGASPERFTPIGPLEEDFPIKK